MEEPILIAKTKTESFDIVGTEWEWVKYLAPQRYEFISEVKAHKLIAEHHLIEVARNHVSVLYDTEDGAFYKAHHGYFARLKERRERNREARTLAKLKNRI